MFKTNNIFPQICVWAIYDLTEVMSTYNLIFYAIKIVSD